MATLRDIFKPAALRRYWRDRDLDLGGAISFVEDWGGAVLRPAEGVNQTALYLVSADESQYARVTLYDDGTVTIGTATGLFTIDASGYVIFGGEVRINELVVADVNDNFRRLVVAANGSVSTEAL